MTGLTNKTEIFLIPTFLQNFQFLSQCFKILYTTQLPQLCQSMSDVGPFPKADSSFVNNTRIPDWRIPKI